ncbi:cytidylyltransferase domain-containing protein [Balneola sp. MJW-20]|uniref:acylneuraminate cytidylyltransferase family protein n=1 Tax=Gracilimonas aurantiaca TaxID=3234185 RepID=UPI003467EA26
MKPLVIIPARGGSKRLPGKNIRPLRGKPLIHYTIEAARGVFEDSVICVSTDDEKIKNVSEQTGIHIPFIRPKELAKDTSDSRSVMLHAVDHYAEHEGYHADTIILLQPTSPLRNAQHIEEAVKLYQDHFDMVVSVKETDSNPYFVLFEENEKGYLKKSKKGEFTRKQDCPKVWELNGAIYVINVESLRRYQPSQFEHVIKYEMEAISSMDVDTELDWIMLESILSLNK